MGSPPNGSPRSDPSARPPAAVDALRSLGWPAVAVVACHLVLLGIHDLLAHPVLFLATYAAATVALWFAVRRLDRPGRSAIPAWTVLAVAALLRVALLPLPPTLSQDMWRYLWDGRVAAAGLNPYRLAPADASLAPLRDATWERLPRRDVPTIYPPAAVALFSIAAHLPRPELAWKAIAAGADLAGCWGLIVLLRRQGRGAGAAVLYAWHPLVVLETAGMGHVDAIGSAAALGAVALLVRGRAAGSAVAAATAVLLKLAPAAALPLWARRSRRPAILLASACILVALAIVPVVVATGGVPRGLIADSGSREFNGPLHTPLTRLLAAGGVFEVAEFAESAAVAESGALGAGNRPAANALWSRWYMFASAGFLARLALGLLALAAIAWSVRERDVVAGTGRLCGRLLLLAATVYPWHLVWVLPWATLRLERSWFVLAASIPLVYLTKASGWPLWPWLFLAVWLPFWVALAAARRRPEVPGSAAGSAAKGASACSSA